MPDISMCEGVGLVGETVVQCEKKKTCYRCTARPSHWQSYFAEAPLTIVDGKQQCDYFWNNFDEGAG